MRKNDVNDEYIYGISSVTQPTQRNRNFFSSSAIILRPPYNYATCICNSCKCRLASDRLLYDLEDVYYMALDIFIVR